MSSPTVTIQAKDLSPISEIGEAEDWWLREFAKRINAGDLSLRLSQRKVEEEPVVHFDARSGTWWTGRYIGEVSFKGRTLLILPRCGVPQMQRWLSRIWGVRILSSKGEYESSRLWLWKFLAKLWETRLLVAAKHGLPTRRFEELHWGPTVRGRLDVRATARELATGRRSLISRTRNRLINCDIASVLLCAFENLRRHLGNHRSWLTPRTQSVVDGLQSQYGPRVSVASVQVRKPIRYTPITESYRPVVELSLAIVQHRPMSSSSDGQRDVFGVLIDMAEVWEMYVYQLLHARLFEANVIHSGRDEQSELYLLKSRITGCELGRLKPDILIRSRGSNQLLAILDAKYKNTTPRADSPDGVHREDLYQMNAYLSALGNRDVSMAGGLVYPMGPEPSKIPELQKLNSWDVANKESSFWFLGLDCTNDDSRMEPLTPGEEEFMKRIRDIIKAVSWKC